MHRYGANLFIRLFRETAQFSRLLRHAGQSKFVLATYPEDSESTASLSVLQLSIYGNETWKNGGI